MNAHERRQRLPDAHGVPALLPPSIGEEEIAEVVDTLRSQWITTGPKTKAFEAQFGAYVGAPGGTSLMLNSCTSGLHLALAAHGIGPGDEVIVPTLTFAATANVVVHLGARPVLVDVLPDTLCIDPAAVERAITPATRAVVPVHYGGHPADLDAIDALAARHGLKVVEDAAHSAPSQYRGTMIGARETLAAFSFYATKNLTTAEGGALTGSVEVLERARQLSLHGMSKDAWKRFDRRRLVGVRRRRARLQVQHDRHPGVARHAAARASSKASTRRRELAQRYTEAFARHPELIPPVERDDVVSSWHLYVLRFRTERLSIDRNAVIEELTARNIGTSVHYRPVHMMSYYAERFRYSPDDFPVALGAFERMVSLPLDPRLSDADADDVIHAVLDIVEAFRK